MPTIREAGFTDAGAIAVFAEEVFRDTFSGQNAPEDMNDHCRKSYAKEIQQKEISSAEYVTLLVEDNHQLIAYAQIRWGEVPDCIVAPGAAELQRFYVHRDWHGKGVAQCLMPVCLEACKKRNTNVIWLGVWEDNPRAIAFYRKFNFHEVGEQVFPLGRDLQRDIILSLELAQP